MLTLALCRDSETAQQGRGLAFEPHIAYLREKMGSICLAAPLATGDIARIDGGDHLVASIFAIEAATFSGAREFMHADPYFRVGVWSRIALFEVGQARGPWSLGSARAVRRLYASLSFAEPGAGPGGADNFRRYADALSESLAFAGLTAFRGELGHADAGDEAAVAVALFDADSLPAASALIGRTIQTCGLPWRSTVWAIPRGVGSWTGDTKL